MTDRLSESEKFVTRDDDTWPLTPRTRFLLWQGLSWVESDLGELLADWGDHDMPGIMDLMPPICRMQGPDWWAKLHAAALRMTEAARTGERLNPRTAGEEAALYLATDLGEQGATAEAVEIRPELQAQLDDLPVVEDDLAWGDVLEALTSDADIALVFDTTMDGIGDPDSQDLASLGLADYRLDSWHVPFERYSTDPDAPTELY